MYSQCPKCHTIFSVSESDIGAYRGLVRCGHCNWIFHAATNEVDGADTPSGDHTAAAEATAPGTRPPAEEQASLREAAIEEPTAEEPREERWESPPPSEPEPMEPEPAEQEAAEQEPAEQEPAEQEAAEQEAAEQETAGQETAGEPAAAEPSLEQPPETGSGSPPETPASPQTGPEAPQPLEQPSEARPPAEPAQSAQASEAQPSSNEPRAAEQASAGQEPQRRETTDGSTTGQEAQEQEASEEQAAPQQPAAEYGFPGEITEEITIEAPPVLWNVFDEETEEKAAPPGVEDPEDRETRSGAAPRKSGRAGPRTPWGRSGKAPPPAGPGSGTGEQAPRRQLLRSPYRDRDVRMVELPRPRPFKTATLSLVTVLLGLLLVWQVKAFYLDELAQVPVLRPYLERLCRPLGCALPPRRDFAQIDLVGTSIEVNPAVPGALEIRASVINRAHFPQPFPPLRVTLTDREGRIVGRRTYLPNEYREGDPGLLPIREVRNVSINLAQPAQNAVGYEVELMAPVQNDAG